MTPCLKVLTIRGSSWDYGIKRFLDYEINRIIYSHFCVIFRNLRRNEAK